MPLAEEDGRLHSSLLLLYGADDEAPVAFDTGQHAAGHRRRPRARDRLVRAVAARLLVVLLGVLASLALAGPAQAHVGGGAAGSDFDARVVSVSPAVPGVTVRVLQFGDEFEVVNTGDADVLVPGYSDEPYLRIGPDGVWRNRNSPATWLNLDRYGKAAADLPAGVDADAEPEWEQVSTEPAYVWHDHRTHWMTEELLPPVVAAAPDQPHTVSEWTVPLQVDGRDVAVRRRPHLEPAAVAVDRVAGLRGRSRWPAWPPGCCCPAPRPLGWLLLVGGAAALWHAAATPEPATQPGLARRARSRAAFFPALTAAAVAGRRVARPPAGPRGDDRADGADPRLAAAGAGAARRRRAVDGERSVDRPRVAGPDRRGAAGRAGRRARGRGTAAVRRFREPHTSAARLPQALRGRASSALIGMPRPELTAVSVSRGCNAWRV